MRCSKQKINSRRSELTIARLFSDHRLDVLEADERALIERLRVLCRDELGPQAADVAREDVFAWNTFRTLARNFDAEPV